MMYKPTARIVYGFHGCDIAVKDEILRNNGTFKISDNAYDWLGTGVYFWECDPVRAMEFAEDAVRNKMQTQGNIHKPSVIGAIIDLGNCLDLSNRECIGLLRKANDIYLDMVGGEEKALRNKGPLPDMKGRFRDCIVINVLHSLIEDSENRQNYDTVRATFFEGNPIYPTSAFHEYTHTQICVRNPNCIKAVFDPRKSDEKYIIP